MPRNRTTTALPALVMALALFPAKAVVAADGRPNFTGTYSFVQSKSDNVREKIAAAAGPDYTVGNEKSEQARVWIRSWLQGITDDPEKRILTIEHTATTFKSGMGDEVHNYYFGREATSRGPAGGNLKVTVTWDGEQLVTEEKQDKGKGRITAIYTLLPDQSLKVDWRLEHSSMKEPLQVRLAFARMR
jgi:hypothetical protein